MGPEPSEAGPRLSSLLTYANKTSLVSTQHHHAVVIPRPFFTLAVHALMPEGKLSSRSVVEAILAGSPESA